MSAKNYAARRKLLVATLWMTEPDKTQFVRDNPGAQGSRLLAAEWLKKAGYSCDRRSQLRLVATIRGKHGC